MKCKYFLFSFFSSPFNLSSSSLISLSYFLVQKNSPVILLSSVFLQKIASVVNIFLINIYHIRRIHSNTPGFSYRINLWRNVSYNLHQNRCCSPSTYSNSLILGNCKKCILNFTDTFNSWFCNLLLWNILSSIHSFIHLVLLKTSPSDQVIFKIVPYLVSYVAIFFSSWL